MRVGKGSRDRITAFCLKFTRFCGAMRRIIERIRDEPRADARRVMLAAGREIKKSLKWIARRLGYEVREIPRLPHQAIFNETVDRDYELLRGFATRAAEFSASPDETRAVRNLFLTGILSTQPYSEYVSIEIGGVDTLQVGIWKRKSGAKAAPFVRLPDRRDEWFYWADKERIDPKRCKWRVALLGESVARGYLYDPHFNAASALEGMLRSQLGSGKIDVVDLAKSNQTLQELKVMVGQCLALRPDVIVIFAGNNWRPHLTDSDIPYVESVLREKGVPGMKSLLDELAEQAVRQLTSEVNTLLDSRKIPVIWVVPEFNLEDWGDPVSNAPLLAGQGNKQWLELGEHASRAMRERDLVPAEKSAKKMVELDGGTSSVPLRILAECCRSNGDLQGTRRYLEMCRDAEGWDLSFSFSPRVSSSIQNALREIASVPKNFVIDLPDLLSRYLNNALPNRRIFLDYCHLTAEGINLVMAAVASKVLASLTDQHIPPQNLQSRSFSPSPKVEGKACFLAAVHNAHFYQSGELVHYWCARALQFWPECAEIMRRIVDFQTRRVPIMACKSTLELFELDKLGTLRYLLRGGQQRLDLVLSEAVVKCVSAIGFDIGKEVSELRVKEHSPSTGPKELTDFYYSSAIPGPSERAWTSRSLPTNRGSHSIYASAFWETSKFVFIGEKAQPIGLRFTYRVPTSSLSDGAVEIDVNGHRVAQAPAYPTWRTLEMLIESNYVVDGTNEIVITWPDEVDSSAVQLSRAADALGARRLPYLYRVYGEIHALLVFDPARMSADFNKTVSPNLNRKIVSVGQ
jgi:hypothetical protein